MKKFPLFIIIFALLVLTPIDTVTDARDYSNQVNQVDEHILAAPTGTDYAADKSREVFNRISTNNYRGFIIKLTENGSREYTNPADLESNNVAARDWIADTLVEVSDGRIDVEILGEYSSVLGRLPGYLPVEGPAFLVGGHFDSVSGAPGANDDATGVATALELARVLSQFNWPIDIYFGAWNAEEIGLIGSREVAEILSDRGVDIIMHYNVDMLLVPDPNVSQDGKILMGYLSGAYQTGLYWAELTRAMSKNFGHHMIQPISLSDMGGGGSSDHMSFIAEGYGSLYATESGFAFDSAYHSPADVWNNPLYNYTVAIEAVKAIGASIAFTLSREFEKPTILQDAFTLFPGRETTYSITITTPTTIDVSCRWWGGGSIFTLDDTMGSQIGWMADPESSPWETTTVMSVPVTSPGIYTLSVFNPSETSAGYELKATYESDIDGNGILDSQEFWFDQVYFSTDSDFDSIDDGREMILGTSRFSNDSDSDLMSDSWEIQNGFDPLDDRDAFLDEDSDGLMNLEEFRNNCNPNAEDTDADSIPDLWEVENNLDPTRDDSAEDPDQDGVSNLQEYNDDTDPHFAEFRLHQMFIPTAVLGVVAVVAVGAFVVRQRR